MTASLPGVKIACFYPWTPFEQTGAWSRFSSLWRFLLEQGAEVTLAFLDQGRDAQLKNIRARYLGDANLVSKIWTFTQKISTAEGKSELKEYSSNELSFLLMYEKSVYLNNAAAGPWLDEIIKDQDVITCEYPIFVPLLFDYGKKWKKPLVVTSHDMLFELHGVHPGAKERLKQKELQALKLADARVFCNEAERKFFESHGVQGTTVLNTGDALGITPGNEEKAGNELRDALKTKSAHFALFVGSAHVPNFEAVAELRRIAKSVPEVTFIVAGSCCPKSTEGNFIAAGPVSGVVLDTLYRAASLILVPLLHGTGMSVKVFQAMAYGKPILSTVVGVRGYTVTDGEEVAITDSPLEFPSAIRRLLEDVDLRRKMGSKARQYAVSLDYRTHFKPYADIIGKLTGKAGSIDPVRPSALVLVDNNLTDRVGHHFNYALSLKEQCSTAGFPFAALIKKGSAADVVSALTAHETFAFGIHESTSLNPYPPEWGGLQATYDFLLSNDQFAKELEDGLKERAASGDLVFLPNATPKQILGVALLLHKNPIYRTLRFVLVLRYSVFNISGPLSNRTRELNKEEAERYAICLERLELADQTGCVRIATDSAELAREYAPYTKRVIEVLPIPHTSGELSPNPPKNIPLKATGKLRIIFLGDARQEKGFELLPAVVRACAQSDHGAGLEFVFQTFISSPYHRAMAPVIEELIRLKLPNVSLIATTLSSEAYQSLLVSADLVLVPYDAATYRARTSGPFVEAICAGKPVVVPKQSWMAIQLGNSLAGETFESGDGVDLARAVRLVVANISKYSKAAEALGKRFREYHNPQNFIQQLMALN